MLAIVLFSALGATQDVQLFATFGGTAFNDIVVYDCTSCSGHGAAPVGFAIGGGVAYAVRPEGSRFTVMPRLDAQGIVTGKNHAADGHLALLLGGSWEHFRAGVGPCADVLWSNGEEYLSAGVSTDLAVHFRPLVVGVFIDALVAEVWGARAGTRIGLIF